MLNYCLTKLPQLYYITSHFTVNNIEWKEQFSPAVDFCFVMQGFNIKGGAKKQIHLLLCECYFVARSSKKQTGIFTA